MLAIAIQENGSVRYVKVFRNDSEGINDFEKIKNEAKEKGFNIIEEYSNYIEFHTNKGEEIIAEIVNDVYFK